ncbi:hypothetical protein V6V47_28590 [Micromonospora sp. CPCC 205539]|uniref:hypothetical protein n=1 Tax=Micromonospora sp. CPCC 205539 TaxID=3122408 RepID=UPI002FEF285C
MEIVEQFVLGKSGDPHVCEDSIVVTAEHAAVIDGATDVSGRRYGSAAGGWWAMAACRDAVRQLPHGVDPHRAVAAMTSELAAVNAAPTLTTVVRLKLDHLGWLIFSR